MTVKKLNFSMDRNGEREAIKVRVFEGRNGRMFADLNGGIFHGWEASLDQLDEMILILEQVRSAVKEGVDPMP